MLPPTEQYEIVYADETVNGEAAKVYKGIRCRYCEQLVIGEHFMPATEAIGPKGLIADLLLTMLIGFLHQGACRKPKAN